MTIFGGGCAGSVGYQTHVEAFCKAAKIDIAKTNESNYKDNITSTLSLITVVFEDFGTAIKLHGKAKDINTIHQTSPIMLFNSGFKFEQGLVRKDDCSGLQKKCLKSLEALSLFGYREYYNNLLCILVEMNQTFCGKKTPFPKTSMNIFNLSHQIVLGHMLRRRNFKEPECHQSYQVVSDKSDKSEMIVHCSVTPPVQFSIGNLPSATTFTDKCGKGWNDTNINKYFTLKKPDDDSDEDSNKEGSAEEVRGKHKGKGKSKQDYMTTSKQFEAHHIILWTMKKILLTKGRKNSDKDYQFHIKCDMQMYEHMNDSICAQHPSLFKERFYTFTPINNLVLLMPFEAINSLKVGEWFCLDNNKPIGPTAWKSVQGRLSYHL